MDMNLAARCLAIGFMFAVGLFAEPCVAEQRVALVIGNGAYRSVPELRNSRNDADDISEQLKRLGFSVIDGRDLDRSAMQVALGRFAQRLKGADAGLVYYSGHGLQIDGQNFLVPVDLKLDDGAFTPFELVGLHDVVEAGGRGRMSPFAAALVREMQVPGLEVATVFRRVAVNVYRETGGAQTPELSVSLLQDFDLNPQESDVGAWQKLGPSASAAGMKAFISRFPTSVMVDAARARLDAIENASERERLVREYAEKERRLRQELETAEAGYRKAASELAERRERDARERVADTKGGGPPVATTSPAPAGTNTGSAPEIAAWTRDDSGREQQMKEQAAKAERERLASRVAGVGAAKPRLAAKRRALAA